MQSVIADSFNTVPTGRLAEVDANFMSRFLLQSENLPHLDHPPNGYTLSDDPAGSPGILLKPPIRASTWSEWPTTSRQAQSSPHFMKIIR
jgi:hypothetical protein